MSITEGNLTLAALINKTSETSPGEVHVVMIANDSKIEDSKGFPVKVGRVGKIPGDFQVLGEDGVFVAVVKRDTRLRSTGMIDIYTGKGEFIDQAYFNNSTPRKIALGIHFQLSAHDGTTVFIWGGKVEHTLPSDNQN